MTNIFKNVEVRKKILFTLFIIVIFRVLAHVPVPGVDVSAIKAFIQGNAFFGMFDFFSGGGFQNFSVVTLGLNPYINASIIIQLFTFLIPSLEELSKEGEAGREKIDMYTRLLSIPMSLAQAYGIYFLLSRQGVISGLGTFDLILLILTMTAGSTLLVWLGDLVTENGVGNGVSLLIFVSIIGRLPTYAIAFLSTITIDTLMNTIIFGALSVGVIFAVVMINEATRNIVIEYGRSGVRAQKITNYLPIKINQAGVIPIIFAISIVMIPSILGGPLQASENQALRDLGNFLVYNFTANSFLYNFLYLILVIAFTFFYTFVQFKPDKIADDIKKRGGFIPGIRPGKNTQDYLAHIVNRVTLGGAVFLGLIAILPYIIQSTIGVANLSIGGTGILIVVSVVLETIRKIESLTVTKNYENYLR